MSKSATEKIISGLYDLLYLKSKSGIIDDNFNVILNGIFENLKSIDENRFFKVVNRGLKDSRYENWNS